MNTKREEKALYEFKHIMDDLLHLLGKAANAKTGYLYWVNRYRNQFVLETTFTVMPNVMFQDRIQFDKFFLKKFKDLDTELQLVVDKDLDKSELLHYFESNPIKHLTLIPFVNNGETVAITVLETTDKLLLGDIRNTLSAYKNAHINVLNTYLELTELYQEESRWNIYDDSLKVMINEHENISIIRQMIESMQKILPSGSISVAMRGMETWVTVLRSKKSSPYPSLGLMVEEKSMAYDALQKGDALFSIHFNQNPKRISSSESGTEGATLAMPLMIMDRRHAVVLAYDKNPLSFSETIKHQLKNLVYMASLALKANMGNHQTDKIIFTTEYGNFTRDLWELTIDRELKRERSSSEKIWFGLIGLENLSELRSKLRLDDLKRLQRTLVKALNPSRLGYNGLIGFHSDYVYAYLFIGTDETHHEQWLKTNIHDMANKLDLQDERKISVSIKAGYVQLMGSDLTVDEVIDDAKQALSEALRGTKKTVNY